MLLQGRHTNITYLIEYTELYKKELPRNYEHKVSQ